MPIQYFIYSAITTIILWCLSLAFYKNKTIRSTLIISGITIILIYIIALWILQERPPLRTLGETRLWYSLFLPIIGFISYLRWKYIWILYYSLALSSLFLCINIISPDNFSKTIMPALQSPWFIPHVLVYIFAYAFLAASSIVAFWGLYKIYIGKFEKKILLMADNIAYVGFSFLSMGLLFGALWAKEAWGHYWTWDPKETWALLCWLSYLIYIHYRSQYVEKQKIALIILACAFVILIICWFGVNYLPTAQFSVHTYSN